MSKTPRAQHFENSREMVATVFRKGLTVEQVNIDYGQDNRSFTLNILAEPSETMTFDLAGQIDPQMSSFKCTPSKIEVKLHKADGRMWGRLEAPKSEQPDNIPVPDIPKMYANWSDVVQEALEDEEKEKATSVDSMFQKIFSEADDKTRRAMIKSYQESAGTVLSTNWDEVSKGAVEIKAPEGMVYKKYEQ